MPTPWTTRLVFVCLLAGSREIASAALPKDLSALVDQRVQLQLNDGRTPRGLLSPASTEEWYILLTDHPDIRIESRFAATIVQDIQPVAGIDSPPAQIPEIQVPPPPEPAMPEAAAAQRSDVISPLAVDFRAGPTILPGIDPLAQPRSLHIDTKVANWDADPENDGLLIRIRPLNGWGEMVLVNGNLDVQLLTETRFATGGRTISRFDHFREAERWSIPVQAIEFNTNGAVYRLPFRHIHPERDLDLSPDALLTARLRVASAGTFDALDSTVRLRSASRVLEEFHLFQDPHRPTGHR